MVVEISFVFLSHTTLTSVLNGMSVTKKSPMRARRLCITSFADAAWFNDALTRLNPVYAISGSELCPSTKKQHNQCYVELKNAIAPSTLGKKLKGHVSIALGDAEANITYCSKEDDHPFVIGDPGPGQGHRSDIEEVARLCQTDGIAAVQADHPGMYVKFHSGLDKLAMVAKTAKIKASVKRKFEEFQPRPWQQPVLDLLSNAPDDRKIHWYWESEGNTGKSYLASFLEIEHGAIILDCSKKADLAHLLRIHDGNVIIFNITRTIADDFMSHIYELAERIKG